MTIGVVLRRFGLGEIIDGRRRFHTWGDIGISLRLWLRLICQAGLERCGGLLRKDAQIARALGLRRLELGVHRLLRFKRGLGVQRLRLAKDVARI
jgi:hypothetical protein